MKKDRLIDNIHLERTVSQIFYLSFCSIFMIKNGKILQNFFSLNFLHLIKQKLGPLSNILDTVPSIWMLPICIRNLGFTT